MASPLEEHASRTTQYVRIQTQLEAHHYLDEVRQKVEPPKAQLENPILKNVCILTFIYVVLFICTSPS